MESLIAGAFSYIVAFISSLREIMKVTVLIDFKLFVYSPFASQ